ncbi:MAG: diacylglycerol kinase [Bacteroidetes bacterium]|nr:MAG: diacylglycerol kinase [Bacteroidota bacterium]
MKILIVVNPISGDIDKEPFLREAEQICHKYGIEYKIYKTTGKDDEALLRALILDFAPNKVASVGGDGTVLFVAKVLLDLSIPMGIVPLGSANGMAKELYVNPNPIKAFYEMIISNIVGNLDMVLVNDQYYSIHIGDVGLNANIVKAYDADDRRGMLTYAKYFLEEIQKIEPFDVSVLANGELIKGRGVMVGICNSRKYGTGVPLNNTGNPMDGLFEIVILKNMDLKVLLKAGLSAFNESFIESQNSMVISAKQAEIIFDKPRLLQLDGEVIGEFEKLKVDILKGAVKLITHADNRYLLNQK